MAPLACAENVLSGDDEEFKLFRSVERGRDAELRWSEFDKRTIENTTTLYFKELRKGMATFATRSTGKTIKELRCQFFL